MTTTKTKEDRQFVTALARGLRILQAFASGEERLSNLEIAERCRLPKSTVTRLTYTLMQVGFLHHLPGSGRYRLGLATLALRRTIQERLDLHIATGTLLQDTANRTRTMVSLAIRDELSIVYIDSCRSQSSVVTLHLDIGSRLPLATTAAGRAFLVASSEKTRQTLMERMRRLDPHAFADLEPRVLKAADDYARHGCVVSFGEWREEINAIAIPMAMGEELPTIVANAAAPAWVVSPEVFMTEVRPQLIAMVRAIEGKYRSTSLQMRSD